MNLIRQGYRWLKAGLLLMFVAAASAGAWRLRPAPYDKLAWQLDFYELRDHIGNLYPNLDWSVDRDKADLHKLNATAFHALMAARSDEEAVQVLRAFVRSFHDPHMSLRRASAPPVDPPPSRELLSRFTPPETVCTALGYRDDADDFAFALDAKAGFRRLPGANSFSAALLDVGGRRFGLLRIGSFWEKDYRGACLREWPRFRQALPGTCEADCQRDFTLSVAGRLLRELAWRVLQLRLAGANALLIDVTDNRGGNKWYRRAAAIVAPGPVSPFSAALTRTTHTVEALQGDRQQVFRYLVRHRLMSADRAVLDQALCRLDDLIAEAEHPCDSGLIWTIEPRQPGCARLTRRPLFSTGLFEKDPGLDLPFAVAQTIYVDHVYPRLPSGWSGPVAVLLDEHTTSAGELFVASLKFSAGAVLLGHHTASSGSGWSLGRMSWTLTHSGMNLYLPDTVGYWPNGENAREGLEPDVRMVPHPHDYPDLTARWLVKVLPTLSLEAPR